MLLICPDASESPDLALHKSGSCHEMIWESGKPINTKEYDISKLDFYCETNPGDGPTDYMLSDKGCLVVSARFKAAFQQFNISNMECFPATVTDSKGQEHAGYYALNVIGLVDCIDRDRSEMDAEEDENGDLNVIFSIDALVLSEDADEHGDCFRAWPFTRIILVSDRIADMLRSMQLTGFLLIQAENWDGINGEK